MTMYTAAYNRAQPVDHNDDDKRNKINVICDAIRHSLNRFNKDK